MIKLFLFLAIFSCFPFFAVEARQVEVDVKDDGSGGGRNTLKGKLSYENYELECVYDNGLSLTFSGEVTSEEGAQTTTYSYSVDIDSYPVSGQVEPPFNSGYKFFYKETETAKKVLNNMKCPQNIQGGLYQQTTLVGSEVEDWEDLDDLTDTSVQMEIYFDSEDEEDFKISTKLQDTTAYKNFLSKQLVGTITPACFSDEIMNLYKDYNKYYQGYYGYHYWNSLEFGYYFYKRLVEKGKVNEDDGCFKFWGKFLATEVETGTSIAKRGKMKPKNVTGNKYATYEFKLVSERVYFNDYVEPVEEIGFKAEGIQAASTPEYLVIVKYRTPGNKYVLLASKDSTISPLTASSLSEYSLESPGGKTASFKFVDGDTTRYLCFSESVKSLENKKNTSAYKFSKIRHVVAGTSSQGYLLLAPKDGSGYSSYKSLISKTGIDYVNRKCTTEGYTFYEEAEVKFQPDVKVGTSICDVIPETAVWIALIIKYLQILVPILLIGLTAFDLSRIVMNDNIEEELPKKRKLIIVRLIVALAFFFIPLFVELIIGKLTEVDFGDVSCLFEDYEDVGSVSDAEAKTEG
jgi:hypothetical protein